MIDMNKHCYENVFLMMIIFDWHDRYDCGFLDDDYFLIGMMCMIGVFGWRLFLIDMMSMIVDF